MSSFEKIEDMKKVFIALANQKGGSGKSTLCALFANYLVEKGKKLFVGDFDNQGTLVSARKSDLLFFPETDVPYNLKGYEIALEGSHTIKENYDYINAKLDEMPSSVDVVLLDTPGNLDEDNLLSLFQRMDYIITPFAYDRGSWDSLKMYRKALRILKSPKYEYKAHFEVFFILNKFDSRIGTTEEHAVWADMNKILSGEGLLTPMIKNIAELKRFNTLFLTRKQRETVLPCFDFIYQQIFGEEDSK